MEELRDAGGSACVTNQVLYKLTRRGQLAGHGMTAMAYSPVEQGRLLDNADLATIAANIDITPSQLALAWVLRKPGVIAIPKASSVAHVRENRIAADVGLLAEILARLDHTFPAPRGRVALEML